MSTLRFADGTAGRLVSCPTCFAVVAEPNLAAHVKTHKTTKAAPAATSKE